MRAFMLNFQHFATAMFVTVGYRRFFGRGGELWKANHVDGAEEVAPCSPRHPVVEKQTVFVQPWVWLPPSIDDQCRIGSR